MPARITVRRKVQRFCPLASLVPFGKCWSILAGMLALSTGGKWAMAVPFYAKEPIMLENTRREFLATAAASAFTIATASQVRSADENSKLEIGVVGCGG